jgi:hypothetical protein
MRSRRIGRHRPDGSANGIQIPARGIVRRGPRLRMGCDKDNRQKEVGGKAATLHDYRVCLRNDLKRARLTRGPILLKTSEGPAIKTGSSDRDLRVSLNCANISHANNVIVMKSSFDSPGGGFHDLP